MPSDNSQCQFAVEVAERLQQAGYRAFWAGGCVRDLLLKRDPADYDVATDARPEQVRKLFGRRGTLAVGASFGVIIVRGSQRSDNVEVATFRTEGPYRDGRRPESVAFSSPEEDAERRDFTVNGMFYDPVADTLHDFVDGQRDLEAGIVRAIGDPSARMNEDKLRMLRAVRFAANLEFHLDEATADAIRDMAADLRQISAERISGETKRMLVDRHRARAMELTRSVGLLPIVFPELQPVCSEGEDSDLPVAWTETLAMLKELQEPSFPLAMAALMHSLNVTPDSAAGTPSEAIRKTGNRLRWSNQEVDDAAWHVAHQNDLKHAQQLPLATLKRLFSHPLRLDLLELHRVRALAQESDLSSVAFCNDFLQNTPDEEINPSPLLTGDDLITLGFRPGRHFKPLLDEVRDAQLNGTIQTEGDAVALAKRLHDESNR